MSHLAPFKKGVVLIGAAIALISQPAVAGDGLFGWIYTLDLQPKGKWEFEQRLQLNKQQYLNSYYVNANQNYTNQDACEGSPSCTGGYPVPSSHDPATAYRKSGIEGGSLEAIYRFTNPVTSPVGVGVYIEPTIGKNKNELAARLLLQSNFLDDQLVLAGNIVVANARLKFIENGNVPESMLDFLVGASYRFAPKWRAGVEARFHNDYSELNLRNQIQRATFVGPNLQYATKDWWATLAWRYQLKGGDCMGGGEVECSDSRVWDSHSLNEFMFKFGIPLN